MVRLNVIEIHDRNFVLEANETKERFEFQIKFFDIPKEVVVGDVLMVNEVLLDKNYKEYSKKLQFGALDEPYGRKIDSRDHKDLICVIKDGQEYWLKRFFG